MTETTPDPTMDAIVAAVTTARGGDDNSARESLLTIWHQIGVGGDAFHRCTLAHYLADLYAEPAESLVWNVRALDAADSLSDERVQHHAAELQVAGFYPSLYLNLADDFRRLGVFEAADEYAQLARRHVPALPDGPYGDTIRSAIDEIGVAITNRDATPRASAPGRVR